MTFREACQTLQHWVEQSQGQPIPLPSGEQAWFRPLRRYQVAEIEAVERTWGVQFPADYRLFLSAVGASMCFGGRYGLGLEFLPLDKVEELATSSFESFEVASLFPFFFPIVSLRIGDEGWLDLRRPAPAQFDVVPHDEDLEAWLAENDHWCPFSVWLTHVVASDGQDTLVHWSRRHCPWAPW